MGSRRLVAALGLRRGPCRVICVESADGVCLQLVWVPHGGVLPVPTLPKDFLSPVNVAWPGLGVAH